MSFLAVFAFAAHSFQHHCLFQYIIIICSNHISIPSYSNRLCHYIQRFLPSQHLHQLLHIFSIHKFTPHIDLIMAFSVLLYFSKLRAHSPSNTMSHFHITLLILRNYDKPSLSFSKKTFFHVTTLRIL